MALNPGKGECRGFFSASRERLPYPNSTRLDAASIGCSFLCVFHSRYFIKNGKLLHRAGRPYTLRTASCPSPRFSWRFLHGPQNRRTNRRTGLGCYCRWRFCDIFCLDLGVTYVQMNAPCLTGRNTAEEIAELRDALMRQYNAAQRLLS